MIPALALAFFTCSAQSPPSGADLVADAERVAKAGNNEEARARVERAIQSLFAARTEIADAADERVFRDAGALAYKLRSLEPAFRAWDAVRAFRAKTLAAESLELQNARGNVSWIGEQLGRVAEARVHEEAMVAALAPTQPADHDALLLARANLGDTLLQLGEFDGALDQLRQVAAARQAKFEAKHPQRLRAELDLACALAGVDDLAGADALLVEVLANAPADPFAIRVRAASDLALVRAARGDLAAFRASVSTFTREIESAQRSIEVLPWRDAEMRTAELRPFADLWVSAAHGFDLLEGDLGGEIESAARLMSVLPRGEAHAVLRRIERSRLEGRARGRRLVTEERFVAAVFAADGRATWVDLGTSAEARALVEAWHTAARGGAGVDEAARITAKLFAPLAAALGDPAVLRIVPDDVVWAVPLHALDLRAKDGRAIPIEALARGPTRSAATTSSSWRVFGDPAPKIAGERSAVALGSGAAASFVAGSSTAPLGAALARAMRIEVEPDVGEACTLERIVSASATTPNLLLALPIWSAPASTPCITTTRAVAASTPLAFAMAREDVVGGSSPADLCGFLCAGFAEACGEDGRVSGAPRAADLRALESLHGASIVLVAWPSARPAVELARDVETLTRALIAAGCADVCTAVSVIPKVGVTFPADLEARRPAGLPSDPQRVPGPWLRVRAFAPTAR